MYAGALGDNAVERYPMFLVSLGLSGDASEWRLALTQARDHGLDMDRVTIAAAECTIEKAFEVSIFVRERSDEMLMRCSWFLKELPPLNGPLPSIIAMQPPATDAELFLLRSIEWTTFSVVTYDTALEQANIIFSRFWESAASAIAT